MNRRKGIVGLAIQEVERRAGVAIISEDERRISEQAMTDLRATWRELDLLGYTVLDYLSGNPNELRPESRRAMAKKSLIAWMNDPQAYRATELLIDFAFGRGVPQPRAKAPEVQRVLDDFWNDTDNRLLVTSAEGQRRTARDLIIQSNVFPLIFDEGDDGKVKTGLLSHDTVEFVVRDDENRLRILYYAAREVKAKFDYAQDRYQIVLPEVRPKLLYYEHWANVAAMEEEGLSPDKPPRAKRGKGKVYHLVENSLTEMAFGVPMMQRTMRWFSAYNDFQAARVDMMKAAAAFIMKRKVKGTPNQLAKMATRAISMQSALASGLDSPMYPTAGRAAAILNENEMVDHESLKIDSGAAQAVQDADMLHGQIAAGTGLPKHYLGSSDANLATATAMELFVIKRVEAFQEIFESFYRVLFDRTIERADEIGLLDQYEAEEREKHPEEPPIQQEIEDPYTQMLAAAGIIDEDKVEQARALFRQLREDFEDQTQVEQQTERDLSYEFSMPSPLRRMMTDLVSAVQNIAQTFDPNNTNTELSRVLLTIALGEGLEVDDPAGVVKRIFPPGYVDPMIAMAQQQQEQMQAPLAGPSQNGSMQDSGAAGMPAGSGSRYGAPMQATAPENVPGTQEAFVVRRRNGEKVTLRLVEQTAANDERIFTTVRGRSVALDALFDSEVGAVAAEELERAALATNGRGGE